MSKPGIVAQNVGMRKENRQPVSGSGGGDAEGTVDAKVVLGSGAVGEQVPYRGLQAEPQWSGDEPQKPKTLEKLLDARIWNGELEQEGDLPTCNNPQSHHQWDRNTQRPARKSHQCYRLYKELHPGLQC
jgi:hypothetical protein